MKGITVKSKVEPLRDISKFDLEEITEEELKEESGVVYFYHDLKENDKKSFENYLSYIKEKEGE